MKKNKCFLILVLIVVFFSFGKVIKANECTSNSCYCTSDGSKCALLRNPRGTYTVHSSKEDCNCVFNNETGSWTKSNPAQEETGDNEKKSNSTRFEVCEHNGIVKAFQIIGFVLNIVKIIVPLLILILGTIELGRAVIANDDKAIKSSINSLVKKVVAGIIIFFVPYILTFVMSMIDNINELAKFDCLTNCLKEPSACKMPNDDGLFE